MESDTNRMARPMQSDSITISKGAVLIYRVFDVAEEINLNEVERVLSQASQKERLRLARRPRHAIIMRNAPVSLILGECHVRIGEREYTVEVSAKVWDYGVISILLQLVIPPGTDWKNLVRLSVEVEDSDDVNTVARQKAKELTEVLRSALQRPADWHGFEDYVVFFLEKFEGTRNAEELLERVDVSSLILADSGGALSQNVEKAMGENVFQYRETDLVVLDWNAALVVEPNGSKEIPDVLEFALTHLLEMRYYDDLLDRRLDVLYDDVEKRRTNIFASRFSQLSHEASMRYIEVSEFIGRVENSLKVVGDFYLARIFRAAVRRFRLNDWQHSINRKMQALAQVSQLLHGEVNVSRSHWLEIVIILLIAFEVVSAFFKV